MSDIMQNIKKQINFMNVNKQEKLCVVKFSLKPDYNHQKWCARSYNRDGSGGTFIS